MGRIEIYNERCKACGICVKMCPKKLLKFSDKFNNSNYNYVKFEDNKNECLGCGICQVNCPDVAITKVYR